MRRTGAKPLGRCVDSGSPVFTSANIMRNIARLSIPRDIDELPLCPILSFEDRRSSAPTTDRLSCLRDDEVCACNQRVQGPKRQQPQITGTTRVATTLWQEFTPKIMPTQQLIQRDFQNWEIMEFFRPSSWRANTKEPKQTQIFISPKSTSSNPGESHPLARNAFEAARCTCFTIAHVTDTVGHKKLYREKGDEGACPGKWATPNNRGNNAVIPTINLGCSGRPTVVNRGHHRGQPW